jgi:enterochelin esterase-like enzyme
MQKIILVIIGCLVLAASCLKSSEPAADASDTLLNKLVVPSKALGKDMRISIFLPDGYSRERQYPVLYLLHGYSHTEDNWFNVVGVHTKAAEMIGAGKIAPLIIVAPQYDNSFGLNSAQETRVVGGDNRRYNFNMGRYEDWLIGELIPYIDANYNTTAAREGRFIGGQSMGGYAALRLAFKYPQLFSKVGGHMPVLWFRVTPEFQFFLSIPAAEWEKSLGQPLDLAATADLTGLRVYLDAGDMDEYKTWENCEKLLATLQSRGVDVQYHPNKGDHSSAYVKANIEQYLLFYTSGLPSVRN